MLENKRAHLEMIQGIINRMAGNSFMLKGWAVTLVAGLFALANKDANKVYFLIAYIPIAVFWGLDSFYLMQERRYRLLYDKVRLQDELEIDFSMNASSKEFNCKKTSYLKCLFSRTEWVFYIPLAVLSTVIVVISSYIK